jgi:osmotically-inducible protein OsmY
VGCAENRPETAAVYSPAPTVALAPTSAGPEQHVYNNGSSTVEQSTVSVSQAPGGANPATWAVAQEIREKLISDPTLAPLGSSLITNVGKDGVVTVQGTVSSPSEEKRVCDIIAALPGVQGVNNQLSVGRVTGEGRLNSMGQ